MTAPLGSSRSSSRRRTTAASAALLLGLALTACGGSDDGGSDDDPSPSASEPSSDSATGSTSEPAPATEDTPVEPSSSAAAAEVPSEEELAALLLTADDVPAGFTVAPDDDDDEDDEDDPFEDTCLTDVGDFKDALGAEPDEEAEVEFTLETATSQAGVQSQVEAYADPSAVQAAFATFTDQLQSCTSVETTTEDGVSIALDITYDDTVDLPGAEDQLAFDVVGTLGSLEQSYPVEFGFVVAYGAGLISLVGTTTVGEDSSGVAGTAKDLARVQSERVAALG